MKRGWGAASGVNRTTHRPPSPPPQAASGSPSLSTPTFRRQTVRQTDTNLPRPPQSGLGSLGLKRKPGLGWAAKTPNQGPAEVRPSPDPHPGRAARPRAPTAPLYRRRGRARRAARLAAAVPAARLPPPQLRLAPAPGRHPARPRPRGLRGSGRDHSRRSAGVGGSGRLAGQRAGRGPTVSLLPRATARGLVPREGEDTGRARRGRPRGAHRGGGGTAGGVPLPPLQPAAAWSAPRPAPRRQAPPLGAPSFLRLSAGPRRQTRPRRPASLALRLATSGGVPAAAAAGRGGGPWRPAWGAGR